MPEASARAASPERRGTLSIGQVLARLCPEFPTLTASKLRFLEVQGIVTPRRTPSGYRKFSADDVERLRLALTLQRDHYLPLARIREYMADVDSGRRPARPADVPPSIAHPAARYRRAELLSAAGAPSRLLDDAITAGVVTPAETYGEQTLTLLRALVALERHGIQPRHMRSVRQAAEREVALIESALAPLLRRTDAASRGQAGDLAPQLAARLSEVRTVLVAAGLDRLVR